MFSWELKFQFAPGKEHFLFSLGRLEMWIPNETCSKPSLCKQLFGVMVQGQLSQPVCGERSEGGLIQWCPKSKEVASFKKVSGNRGIERKEDLWVLTNAESRETSEMYFQVASKRFWQSTRERKAGHWPVCLQRNRDTTTLKHRYCEKLERAF